MHADMNAHMWHAACTCRLLNQTLHWLQLLVTSTHVGNQKLHHTVLASTQGDRTYSTLFSGTQ